MSVTTIFRREEPATVPDVYYMLLVNYVRREGYDPSYTMQCIAYKRIKCDGYVMTQGAPQHDTPMYRVMDCPPKSRRCASRDAEAISQALEMFPSLMKERESNGLPN